MKLGSLKSIVSLILLVTVLMMLAACSNGNSSPNAGTVNTEETSTPVTSNDSSSEKIKLTFQNAYPDETNIQHRVMKQIVENYMNENPNVTIVLDSLNGDQQKIKLKTQAASDSMPDITVVNASAQMEPFVTANKLAPLNDILAIDGLGDSFQQGILDYFTFDDQVYALPDGNNVAVVYYNKTLFEQAGVSIPTTFDELLTAVETFSSKGIIPMAIGEKETWTGSYLFMNIVLRLAGPGYLADVMNGTKTFNDPAFVESISKMEQLVQSGAFQEGATSYDYDMASSLFTTGQAAMYFMGTWATAEIEDAGIADEVGVFSFPTVDGQGDVNEYMLGPGTAFALSANSPNLEAAKLFLHYYMKNYPIVAFEMKNAVGLAQDVEGDFASAGYSQLAIEVLDLFKSVTGGDIAFDSTLDASTTQIHLNSIQNVFVSEIISEDVAAEHQAAFEENN